VAGLTIALSPYRLFLTVALPITKMRDALSIVFLLPTRRTSNSGATGSAAK
jgi:hypothetical protein